MHLISEYFSFMDKSSDLAEIIYTKKEDKSVYKLIGKVIYVGTFEKVLHVIPDFKFKTILDIDFKEDDKIKIPFQNILHIKRDKNCD